jgi:hypothetical protein
MDDKSKSLRQKRTGKLKISAPTLISAPASANNTIDLKEAAAAAAASSSVTAPSVAAPSVALPSVVAPSSRPSTASTVATQSSRRDGGLPQALRTGLGPPGAGGLPGANPRPRANDQTADLVKRRYSTRFTNPPDLSNVPPMPTLPSMPRKFAQEKAEGLGKKIVLDPVMMKDANFDAETCMNFESCLKFGNY